MRLKTLDTFAREQKRRWFAEGRRGVKLARRAVRNAVVQAGRWSSGRWARSRVRWAHDIALWWPKLRRPVKVLAARSGNAAVASVNLTRKTGRRVWSWARPVIRMRARARRTRERMAAYREESRIELDIEQAVEGRDPIVVGPWLSEVGYETLYWVPFVRWVQSAYRLKPERLLVISRGGVAAWYADITPNYLEIFEHLTVEEVTSRNQARADRTGTIKQDELSPFELELVELGRRHLGVDRVQVLHPGLMYRLFRQFWAGNRSFSFLDEHTRYRRIEMPAETAPRLDLPPGYVAMKFYTAASLQDGSGTRHLLRDLVASIAERHPVVLLDTGLSVDDHADYAFDRLPGVTSARLWMRPADNLGVQTRVIAGARAFVGTCGGLAWLAPMLGVPTLPVMTGDRWLNVHLHVARRVYRVMDAAPFAPLDLGALGPMGLTLAARGLTMADPA